MAIRKSKKRSTKLLGCLKKCMFSEDRKSHKVHEKTAEGRAFLETHQHTDQLLELCVPKCKVGSKGKGNGKGKSKPKAKRRKRRS